MSSDQVKDTPNGDEETPDIYKRTGPRIVYDEITGYPAVAARPGVPKITSEDVKRMLEDFP
jgi:hypothetical protein